MVKNKIKAIKSKKNQQGKILAKEHTVNYEEKTPIFSLERLQSGKYCLKSLDKDGKASFADAIYKRKNISWKDIKQAPRHGIGFEKIAKDAIKAAMPRFITEDVDNLLAFRFDGKKPMVGYRKNDVFYVLWFDNDFTLYPH